MRSPVEAASLSYVLTDLDVYDWGAFGGRHSATIDLAGTAIIGPTGSGKTTLVDALMTLLVASPRYNLASTGGHNSDRDLVSYVRGVSGAGNDSDANEHVARNGPVVTAIAARLCGGDKVARLGGLFWFEGTSSALGDLRRRWFFAETDAPDLDAWLEAHRAGGVRALKELERAHPGLTMYETKQTYLARLRTHFEVGENAFTLLNRAAGLKQLDSIDEVFREHVLDDHSAFEAARIVADEFDTLAGIRQELEVARRQRDTLLPIEKNWLEHEDVSVKLSESVRLLAVLPAWFGEHAIALWQGQTAASQSQLDCKTQVAGALQGAIVRAVETEQACQTAYLQTGGQRIEELRRYLLAQADALDKCRRAAALYQAGAKALGLDTTLTISVVRANKIQVGRRRTQETAAWEEQKQNAWEVGAQRQALVAERDRLSGELSDAKLRPASSVPRDYNHFRVALAAFLGIEEDQIPFLAELIEVLPGESAWRGAIERAVGGERLRLLIAPVHLQSALDWINSRHSGLHVRLREASAPSEQARFFDDGFTRKLQFKAHPHREAVKHLLAGIDRHCVPDVRTLRRTPHAMTIEGLMSGRSGFFDKQDHKRLDQDWMTGFDNRAQLARLQNALGEAQKSYEQTEEKLRVAESRAEATRKSLLLLDRIEEIAFEDIDVPGAETERDHLQAQLDALLTPASDLERARADWEAAQRETKSLRDAQLDLNIEIKLLEQAVHTSEHAAARIRARIGAGLDESERALASNELPQLDATDPSVLDDMERERGEHFRQVAKTQSDRVKLLEQHLVREMGKAKAADTGALTDAGTDILDIRAYRERLRVLNEEALPEKLERFQHYLNVSSDQGVVQLLSQVEGEVSAIEERIASLNTTLQRVDFQPGRYLHLDPQRVEHESLRTLQKARALLRSAQLKDDQGESHYGALSALVALLRDAVDRRKTQGALALLDPRYRLRFAVLVIDREAGKTIERRTSSQGGSGGEKEIIASYVLTASLSYALCPDGSQQPLFASIVLDEAFSKSSQAVAGRIIRALAEFGLHPLFVTPNKELRLLREHTRSAIVIHRKGSQATMTSLSWEVLEAHARRRGTLGESRNEVA